MKIEAAQTISMVRIDSDIVILDGRDATYDRSTARARFVARSPGAAAREGPVDVLLESYEVDHATRRRAPNGIPAALSSRDCSLHEAAA